MTHSFRVALTAAAVLLLSLSAFATDLHLTQPANFNGKQLAPGDYQLSYKGSAQDVRVTLRQGKDIVATAKARMEDLGQKSPYDAFVTEEKGGSPVITKVLFAGKSRQLIVEEPAGETGSMGK